ncbi:cytochrome c/FTR1 family iron permease [Microbulbifer discodermiae]|uniref:cytochrome c/FTR1 family iron permease n=1 Tax=Microbulbifer sp. 2201CG32-9 TaxID=3232309 RepID=UPI00345BF0F8
MRSLSLFFYKSLLLLLLAAGAHGQAEPQAPADLRQLMQLAEYIGVDYAEAVRDGQIINGDEYSEMEEFAQLLVDRVTGLEAEGETRKIHDSAAALQAAIRNKASLAEVQTLTAALRQGLVSISPQLSLPQSLLQVEQSATLYQAQCAACHGNAGKGDGPLAAQLEPAPTDFHDVARAENRSLLGLYDAISNGIDGTAMAAFANLTDQQRWSLAFYVGGLAFKGSAAAEQQTTNKLGLQDLVMYSPKVLLRDQLQTSPQAIAALRADPSPLFAADNTPDQPPLQIARSHLEQAFAAYQRGDYSHAQSLAISAYLDGFELAETSLDSHDKALRLSIERELLALRAKLNASGDPQAVQEQVQQLLTSLETAESLMQENTLSGTAVFFASLLILLREGLEALLIVIALVTILIKSKRNDAIKYVHLGWVTALAAGTATWLAAQQLINISGASREVMEGVAAALAAAVLFYVGYWMHSKTNAQEWQKYIQNNIDRSLSKGTLWGIAALAFLAVYREIFETILFYQALMTQTSGAGYGALWSGTLAAAGLLLLTGWAMVRYSARLPIGKFFTITTYFLLGLSFVLAGKAVAALQEAALLNISPLPVAFSFDWLGIYPTWQGVGLQFAILVAAFWLWRRGRNSDDGASTVKV